MDYILYNQFCLEFPDLKLFQTMTILEYGVILAEILHEKTCFAICEQQILRCKHVCKSAQSDQHHLCSLLGYNNT